MSEGPETSPDPQIVAVKALTFLAIDPALLQRFLDHSGMAVDQFLNGGAGKTGSLVDVLKFILADRPTTLTFATHAGLEPRRIEEAKAKLVENDEGWEPEAFVDDLNEQVQAVGDDIIADYPDESLAYLAEGLERALDSYEDGPEMARLVAAELRRRAKAQP